MGPVGAGGGGETLSVIFPMTLPGEVRAWPTRPSPGAHAREARVQDPGLQGGCLW